MYIARKPVYYCDFCRKYRLRRASMIVHEKCCTLNPNRVCGLDGCDGDKCPLCQFARARQSGFANDDWRDRDLRAETAAWIREVEEAAILREAEGW